MGVRGRGKGYGGGGGGDKEISNARDMTLKSRSGGVAKM